MKLSAKMPATMDPQMAARMPATQESEAPSTGGDGPMMAPQVAIRRDSAPQDAEWQAINEDRKGWMNEDHKTGSTWEATDRKETATGGRPQRTV